MIASGIPPTTTVALEPDAHLACRNRRRLAMPVSRKMEAKIKKLKAAFDVFDADGSGALDHEEMREVLKRPGGGQQMTDDEIKEIIQDFDANGDGAPLPACV